MSNRDRAVKVAAEFLDGDDLAANIITRLLADAGLIAPDLPEPELCTSGDAEWDALDGYVNLNDGLITVTYRETDEDDDSPTTAWLRPEPGKLKILDLDTAEKLGTFLTAAAKYAATHSQEGKGNTE